MQRTRIILTALSLAVSTASLQAQAPVAHTAGVISVPVAGSSAATQVAVPFTREPVLRDVVSSVSGSTITGVGGGYGSYANTHMVLLASGASRGASFTITSNTASDVTVTGTLPSLTNGVDEFEIVPLNTLTSVFGGVATSGPYDLAGGPSAASADIVIIGGSRYFYKTSGANAPGWKLESAPNAVGDLGTTVVPNLAGTNVIRKGAATNVRIRGIERSTRGVLAIGTGTNLLSWPFAAPVTLLESGLQSSITGGPSAASADIVLIGGVRYFYKTSGANSPGWKLESSPNAAQPGANNVVLNNQGKAFYIIRAGAATTHGGLEKFATGP